MVPTARPDPDEALVLAAVAELASELTGGRSRPPVRVDSRLEEELGLDSLAIVELRSRLEQAFAVELADGLLATAATPADWLTALRGAGRRPGAAGPVALPPLPPRPVAGSPRQARTLVDALAWHVDAHGERLHLRILYAGADPGAVEELSYAALLDGARTVAGGLRERGVGRGDAVALMLPTGRGYFEAFVAILLAGAVPVPLYPPARPAGLEDHLRRQVRILDSARVSLLVTDAEALTVARLLRPHVVSLGAVTTVADLRTAAPAPAGPPVDPGATALVQYTSGSTGNPKGVVLTHEQLLANIRAMGEAAGADAADVFVSWLPLYHDMGLIGAWLGSLVLGFPLVVLPPTAFLARPARWLQTLSASGGTLSASPNFGYELCLRHVTDEELAGVDLSSWRMAFNGAEPVSASTVRRFAERFGPWGFRPETMAPVYGLAEVGVGLCFPPPRRPPLVDVIDRDVLGRTGRAVPSAAPVDQPPPGGPGQAGARLVVACGRPIPGYQVRVVDAAGRELPDRHEGRIECAGPSTTSGYLHDPTATGALYRGEWLDTGDLGYLGGGDLFVTGRTKDLVIRAGRNLHPEELEEAVGALPGVRKGCVAAFASADPAFGTERLVVVAETRLQAPAERDALRRRIVTTAVEVVGTPPDEVVLAAPGAVAKTSSGKIRRAASRERFEAGQLHRRLRAPRWQVARFALSGVRARLDRLRRSAGAVAYGAAVWALLVLVAPALWLSVVLLPGRQRRWRLVRSAGRQLSRLVGIPLTVRRAADAGGSGPRVFVANHGSFVDSLALAVCLPGPLTFVAGEVFADQRLAGPFLRALGCRFVHRHDPGAAGADVAQLVSELHAGHSLVSFPEGSLHRAVGVRPFHLGAFAAAATAGVPVVPVGISGSRDVVRPGERLPRRGAVVVAVGAPVAAGGASFAEVLALRDAARAAVCDLSGEPDLLAGAADTGGA